MTAERLAQLKRMIVSIGVCGSRDAFKWAESMFAKYPELKNA